MANRSGRHGAGGRTADVPSARPRVLLWFDYACPLCFVSRMRFDELESSFDIEVVDLPFELREGLAREGASAAVLGIGHTERYERHVLKEAAEHGIQMHLPDLVPNTHRALILGEVGRDAGADAQRRVNDAVFRAYFVDQADIGADAVLLEIASAAGLDPAAVEAAWGSERYEQRLHSFRHLALGMGVTATPAALICNELLIGSRPLKLLEEAVSRCVADSSPRVVERGAEGDGGGTGEVRVQ